MPIERLAVVLLQIKERRVKKGHTQEVLHCSKCGRTAPANKEKRWTSWGILFFPFYTAKRRFSLVCSQCDHLISEKKASLIESMLWYFI